MQTSGQSGEEKKTTREKKEKEKKNALILRKDKTENPIKR
jgi:hypothetical protein